MKPSRLLAASAAFGLVATGFAMAAPQAAAPIARPAERMMKVDANGDGVVDRAEAAKFPRMAERFDQLDRNKDGRISADERPMRGKAMHGGKCGRHGMRARLQQLDADKDGRISRAEAARAPRMAEHFAMLDVNKDGFLDPADRQQRMQQHRAEWFKAADSNNDGQLSRAEFDAQHAKRMEHRKAARGQR